MSIINLFVNILPCKNLGPVTCPTKTKTFETEN